MYICKFIMNLHMYWKFKNEFILKKYTQIKLRDYSFKFLILCSIVKRKYMKELLLTPANTVIFLLFLCKSIRNKNIGNKKFTEVGAI